MHHNQSYQKEIMPQYVEALLSCAGRKVCTNLANAMNTSHDKIYQDFEKTITSPDEIPCQLEELAKTELNEKNTYLLLDDFKISKLYAHEIEGIEVSYDGSVGLPLLGLTMVNALLTDTNINIPINTKQYVSKELAQSSYMTKSDIGIAIVKEVIKRFTIKRILADAHYASNQSIQAFSELSINFLMKIPRHRVVTINGVTGQLQNILRLKKNSRSACKKGLINGIECYFYVVKLDSNATVYLISNDYIDPYTVYELYRIRWNIELFHRTSKQYLGIKDCQMRSAEKQRQHVLHVMHAYALASIYKYLFEFDCVEDAIKSFRDVKLKALYAQKPLQKRTLC